MTLSDYSQEGDPYKIAEEYTQQSASTDAHGPKRGSENVDGRGNSLTKPRSVPTQEEANAIMREPA